MGWATGKELAIGCYNQGRGKKGIQKSVASKQLGCNGVEGTSQGKKEDEEKWRGGLVERALFWEALSQWKNREGVSDDGGVVAMAAGKGGTGLQSNPPDQLKKKAGGKKPIHCSPCDP